jgi:hypothetical protein
MLRSPQLRSDVAHTLTGLPPGRLGVEGGLKRESFLRNQGVNNDMGVPGFIPSGARQISDLGSDDCLVRGTAIRRSG